MRALVVPTLVGIALLAATLSSSAQAEDGWRAHALGEGGPTLLLPERWTVLVDDLEGRLLAHSDDAPRIRLVAHRMPVDPDLSLPELRDRILDTLFGAPGEGAVTEDEAERPVGEQPALWTLVAYETPAGPRRSLLVVRADMSLRFDLAAGAFPARRALVVRIVDALQGPQVEPAVEAGAEETVAESDALDLLREFMTRVPRTRAELAELSKALGREAEVTDALDILDDLVEAAGPTGTEVLALVGWRRFDQPLPESLHYRGHAFVQAVERANTQRWFGPAERPALDLARRAWAETKRHVERLESDHRYRAGDQMVANLAKRPLFRDHDIIARSAPPYVIVHASREPLSLFAEGGETPAATKRREAAEARMDQEARVLTAVHRKLQATYADSLLLADLSAPFGGRPDLPVAYRSFPDGLVLAAVIPPDARLPGLVLNRGHRVPPGMLPALTPGEPEVLWLPPVGEPAALHGTATIAAKQLLLAFTRQRNRWNASKPGFVASLDGFAQSFGSMREQQDGSFTFRKEDAPSLVAMRAMAMALRHQGERAYPVLPLKQLVSFGSMAEARQLLRGKDPYLAQNPRIIIDQSWALATFLMEAEDGRWRTPFLELVRSGLDRELGPGMSEMAFARAFELRTAADWQALQYAWERFVREELLGDLGRSRKIPAPSLLRIHFFFDQVEGREPTTRIRLGGVGDVSVELPREGDDGRADALERLDDMLREHVGSRLPLRVEVAVRQGQAGEIPFGDVVAVLERLRKIGATDITFERARPIPVRGEEAPPREPDED